MPVSTMARFRDARSAGSVLSMSDRSTIGVGQIRLESHHGLDRAIGRVQNRTDRVAASRDPTEIRPERRGVLRQHGEQLRLTGSHGGTDPRHLARRTAGPSGIRFRGRSARTETSPAPPSVASAAIIRQLVGLAVTRRPEPGVPRAVRRAPDRPAAPDAKPAAPTSTWPRPATVRPAGTSCPHRGRAFSTNTRVVLLTHAGAGSGFGSFHHLRLTLVELDRWRRVGQGRQRRVDGCGRCCGHGRRRLRRDRS